LAAESQCIWWDVCGYRALPKEAYPQMLTDRMIQAAKPAEKPYRLSDEKGRPPASLRRSNCAVVRGWGPDAFSHALEWLPSHIGAELVCLHPQRYAVPDFPAI
jgi:hypothetical protein